MAKLNYVPEKTLLLHDRRMLLFMVYAVNNNYMGVKGEYHFLEMVSGSTSKGGNIMKLKKGTHHFVIADIKRCCEKFGTDANYFFLEGHLNMFRQKVIKPPFEQLLAAVQAVGMEMGAFTPLVEEEETEAQKLKRSLDIIEAEKKRKIIEAKENKKVADNEAKRKKKDFEWVN